MSSQQPDQGPAKTPFDATVKTDSTPRSSRGFMHNLPPGTMLGLAITAGALAVILFSAVVYRLTPQPKSPYLVNNSALPVGDVHVQAPAQPASASAQPASDATLEATGPETPDEPPLPLVANESPEAAAERRLKEERRVQERNIAEQRELEDKKRTIERQIEDKQAEEKRRLEDKVLEDARAAEDKKLMEAREAEDKRIEEAQRLEAEREEAERKLAASQP